MNKSIDVHIRQMEKRQRGFKELDLSDVAPRPLFPAPLRPLRAHLVSGQTFQAVGNSLHFVALKYSI